MQDNEIMVLKAKIRRHNEERGCDDNISLDEEDSQLM